jgi:hypothetical protein
MRNQALSYGRWDVAMGVRLRDESASDDPEIS